MKNKEKHLTSGNVKGFFDGMKAGDEFTFNPDVFNRGQVLNKATKAGFIIEIGEGNPHVNRRATVVKLIEKVKQPELPLDESEMKLPVRELLFLAMNRTDPSVESKAAWLACLAKEGMLSAEIKDCHIRMGSSFYAYFGASFEYVIERANAVEMMKNDEAMNLIIGIAADLSGNAIFMGNYNALKAFGLQREIEKYCLKSKEITGITRLELELAKKVTHIIELNVSFNDVRGRKMHSVAGSNGEAFDSFEGALMHVMFGDDLYPAAAALFLAYNLPKRKPGE